MHCKKCLHYDVCVKLGKPSLYGINQEIGCSSYKDKTKWEEKKEPENNADRLRAMSDEELARKLVNASYRYDWKQDEDYWYFPNGTTKTNYKPKAIEAWLEWLKQPAEVDNG